MSENLDKLQQKQVLAYAKDLVKIYEAEKEKRANLELANKKLRATLDGISEGIVTLDEKYKIIEANLAFSKIAGLPLEKIIGKPMQISLSGEGWTELHNSIDKISNPQEITINPDKQKEQFFKVILSPISNKKNKFESMVITFQDISQRERNNRLKEEFLGLISHEIRTPLAGIIGFAELLQGTLSEQMSDDDLELFQLMKDSSDRLTRTIEELVDAAQFSETATADRIEFDLISAVNESIYQVQYKLDTQNIKIQFQEPDISFTVYGFEDQIIKAIQHLLENAIEFSLDNSNIDVKVFKSDEMVVVEVQDYGEGIPENQLEIILNHFNQSEFYMNRKHEGLGLGLSIVKKIAVLHHGKIELESKPGKGTKAVFSLPVFEKKKDTEKSTDIDELKKQIVHYKQQTKNYAEELAATYTSKKDISKKLFKTQQQIIRADKLATMGQMAAGIAHEVNNKLTPMLGQIQLLLMGKDQLDPNTLHWLQIINDSGFKAADMLRQILDFTHKSNESFEPVDIANLINKTVTLFDYRFRKSSVELIKQLEQEQIEVFGNAGQLEQVFTNLIGNAIDAMGESGQLTIEAAVKEEIKKEQSVSWAEINITDTGSGMDKETQESIFEPFFTTKEEGKGTGLGLFITHQIIENHGGSIDVKSEINKGTIFIIKLNLFKKNNQNI